MQKSSLLTHNKLNKQLQNSLWLRIYSGQVAFMQSRLNNSTKFHFGIIRNDFKTNRKQFNQQQQQQNLKTIDYHSYNSNTNNKSKNNNNNKSKSSQLVNDYSFHLPWSDRCHPVTCYKSRASLKQPLDKEAAEERPTKWIRNNSFASNGTVIRPIWRSHSPIYTNRKYWPMSHYPAMVSC